MSKFQRFRNAWVSFILEYVLSHYRWIFVCFLLLPVSAVYAVLLYVRNAVIFRLRTAAKLHDVRVKHVQKQVQMWNASKNKVPMCTARPGWLTMSLREGIYKETLYKIKIDLVDILEVNETSCSVRVEPLVTMGQITSTLNPLGWTLPIVPELDDLTVGGMLMGNGVESSSHKYGMFQNICISYEIVIGDGSLVKCTETENSDLFHAIPWSHGTLGFLVAAELRIVPAKPFVCVQYQPCQSAAELVATFDVESKKKDANDFVEGIAFSKDSGVVMTATMTDSIRPNKLNRIGQYHKPWFYKHVEGFLKTGPSVEYIPLRDYYHRHSKGLFWELQYIIPFGNNFFFRHIFGHLLPPKVSLMKLTQGETIRRLYEKHHFLEDYLIPMRRLKTALRFFHETVNIYPVWLCPFNLSSEPGMVHSEGDREEMYVDVGLYGEPKVSNYDACTTHRKCETYVKSIRGFQMLYADSYQSREEFREMFDHSLYDKVRMKLRCEGKFPDVYDKVNKKARR